jgi:hypothetical protein
MNHISDWLTHIDNKEDIQYLRSKLPDVNMRLFSANMDYKAIVLACCRHIQRVCLAGFEGYKLPHGTSGANCAIPFNIIAIARNRGKADAWSEVMINPIINDYHGELVTTTSNCGSIRLKKPIKVNRWTNVVVSWFTTYGKGMTKGFSQEEGSFTIQHEVDHNLGILITDKEIK